MKDKSKKSTYSTTFGVDPFGVDPIKRIVAFKLKLSNALAV